jgi:hypothetical protein
MGAETLRLPAALKVLRVASRSLRHNLRFFQTTPEGILWLTTRHLPIKFAEKL